MAKSKTCTGQRTEAKMMTRGRKRTEEAKASPGEQQKHSKSRVEDDNIYGAQEQMLMGAVQAQTSKSDKECLSYYLPTLIYHVQNLEKMMSVVMETLGDSQFNIRTPPMQTPLTQQHQGTLINTSKPLGKDLKDFTRPDGKPEAPYRYFIQHKAPSLDWQTHRVWKKCLEEAGQVDPLAFFLLEKRQLTKRVKAAYKRLFIEFHNKGEDFSPQSIKYFLLEKDLSNDYTISTLESYHKKFVVIGQVVYGYEARDFPSISFSSPKEGTEGDKPAIPKKKYVEAIQKLNDQGELEKSLLIEVMWCFASRPNETFHLTFEDFSLVDDVYQVRYYSNKKGQRRVFSIDQGLYERVMGYKERLMQEKKYKYEIRRTTTGKAIKGHFLFNYTKDQIKHLFNRTLPKLVPGFSHRPKDIRMSSISDISAREGLIQAQKLGQHTTSRITRQNYIRTKTINPDSLDN